MKLTEGKLDEAKFFLTELEKVYFEYVDNLVADESRPPTSQYYFSAFISSARSVMWVMRYEYHDIPGWEMWYDGLKAKRDREEIELLDKINGIRVRSEKRSPLMLGVNIAFRSVAGDLPLEIDETLPPQLQKRFNIKLTKLSSDGESIHPDAKPVEAIATIGSFFLALEELPNEDVLKLCRSYLDFLTAMVSDCKKRFG
jgi:hypothetical protein